MAIDKPISERDDLSEAKRRLLAQRLKGFSISRQEPDRIQPRPAGARTPISADQYRVWLHASAQPDLPTYNEPITIQHRGSLDLDLLEASINRFLQRHEAWRTSFAIDQEEVLQVVHPTLLVSLERVDLSGMPELEREAEAKRLATCQALRPISLTEAPLFRTMVIRLAPDNHRLYMVLHHIIFDGLSIQRTFIPELAAIYAALEFGVEPVLPDLSLQYCDYAIWRQQQIDSAALDTHVDYWRALLADEPPVLRLPSDRPRPSIISQRGSMERFIVPRELMDSLRALGAAHGATLYMTLLAAFKVLLFRYSGQEDIIVGGAADARRRPELQGMMGYLLDTFAVRTYPSSKLPFSGYLSQVKNAVLGALDAADVPFERVMQAAGIKRDLSYHPIFQTFFSLQPNAGEFPPGWDMTPMDINVGAAKFDIYLEIDERPSHTAARIVYSTDLFDADTIRRMSLHWLTLLEAICETPDCPLGDLSLLTAGERDQLLYGWNDTRSEFPSDACIHELFEEQVRKTPQAIAVVFEDASLSYAELNARANQLAHYLLGLGVRPDTRVAVCVERGQEMIIGLLAVLKAGGAYVPLDPIYPPDRINFMLEDSAPVALLTQAHLRQVFSGLNHMPPVLELDSQSPPWIDQSRANPDPPSIGLGPQHLAYIIYTSGSTGVPKGVMVEHRGLCNRIVWMQRAYELGSGDAVLQKTPFSFDVSVWEFFWPIVAGAKLVMARPEGHKDPSYLYQAIQRNRITTMHFVPSMLSVFLEQDGAAACSSLTDVMCSGEALPGLLAQRFQKQLPKTALHNLYGPTETTVDVTAWTCPPGLWQDSIPIGRPIANTQIYILDTCGKPVPVGVVGELYIGGAGVARGYLNRPDLTAERFLADPFSSEADARMYKTGDLGRWLTDGNIEFLGRNDFQVKIRGFRIELGEIEARLAEYPGVSQAIVIAREDTPGDKRLAAYYTLADGANQNIGAEQLRPHLSASLPEYMVPAAFLRIDSLPLTPNGKLDRKALPAPNSSSLLIASRPPSTREERRLAKIWSEVLGVDCVNRDDNFFDLGGHSILLVRLFARINKEFGSNLPITTIFDTPTLSALAKVLRDKVRISSLVPVQTSGTKPPLFMVHSYLIYHGLSDALGNDQPFYGLRELPEDGNESIEERAVRYVSDIKRIQQHGPYRLAGWCAAGPLAVEIARQLLFAGEEIALLVLFDSWLPGYAESLASIEGGKSRARILTAKLAGHKAKLHGLSTTGQLRYLWRAGKRIIKEGRDRFYIKHWSKMSRLSNRLNVPLPQFMHNSTLQVFAALQQFRTESIPVRITLIRATDSSEVAGASASHGWEKVAELGVEVLWAPGDHETMFRGSNLQITAELVSHRLLENAQSLDSTEIYAKTQV